MMNNDLLEFVRRLREQPQPVGYVDIEELVYKAGFRTSSGKRIHNAALSKAVADKFPHLRRRTKKKESKKSGRPKGSKNKPKNICIKSQIDALKSDGFSDKQIVKILSIK